MTTDKRQPVQCTQSTFRKDSLDKKKKKKKKVKVKVKVKAKINY